MKIAYVLSYRAPNYIRSKNIIRTLQSLPEVTLYIASNRRTNFLRYFETLFKLVWVRLRYHPDIYFLGFRGHEIYWLIRLITLGRPLIFDSLMSPYGALRQERKAGKLGVAVSKIVFYLERAMLKNCHRILTDTDNHVRFFAETFDIPENKIIALPMSAVEEAPTNRNAINTNKLATNWQQTENTLKVLFYGSFLPLHGVDVVLKAITLIDQSKFSFHFIGGKGKILQQFHDQVRRLAITNISHETWVTFENILNHYIPFADICLGGPFGDTAQSRRVITGKTVQCLAQARTTVIGKIDSKLPFKNQHNCLLVEQGNPMAIADALQWAAQNRQRLTDIGNNGRSLYNEHFSNKRLQQILGPVLEIKK